MRAPNEGDEVGVVPRQNAAHLDQRHLGAEPPAGLGELAADGAAADDEEALEGWGLVEEGLVRQVGHGVQPRDRRGEGPAAGGERKAPCPDRVAPGLKGVRPGEARARPDDPYAQPLEPLDAVVGGDAGDHVLDMRPHGARVDTGLDGGDAEGGALSHHGRPPPGGDQALGGHAADVEAVAAHRPFLDQDDLGADLRRPRRERQPGRAGADNAKIGGKMGHGRLFAAWVGEAQHRAHRARPR